MVNELLALIVQMLLYRLLLTTVAHECGHKVSSDEMR